MTNYPLRISRGNTQAIRRNTLSKTPCVLLQATIPLKLHNLTDYTTSSQKLARSGIERSPETHN